MLAGIGQLTGDIAILCPSLKGVWRVHIQQGNVDIFKTVQIVQAIVEIKTGFSIFVYCTLRVCSVFLKPHRRTPCSKTRYGALYCHVSLFIYWLAVFRCVLFCTCCIVMLCLVIRFNFEYLNNHKFISSVVI